MRRAIAAGGMLLVGSFLVLVGSAADGPPVVAPPASAPAAAIVRGTLHTVTLPEVQFELPSGAGRDTTQAYCVACHTTRYILLQPSFSREVWLAEVTKMRKAFSAPIPEQKVAEIVDYLVAVRGVPAK